MTEIKNLLELDVSAQMSSASKRLCDLKLWLDLKSRYGIYQSLQNDLMDAYNTCSFFGSSYLSYLVPFIRWNDEPIQEFEAYVDPRSVVGACINGKPDDLDEAEATKRIERYSAFTTSNRALYCWYKPLGILVAHEGKHRVALMRKHGNKPIAAVVTEKSYPAAERIQLIKPSTKCGEWFALLDGRYLQMLPRPHLTCEYLTAYGVQTFEWRTLTDLPPEDLIRKVVYERGLHKRPDSNAESARTLDLDDLRAQLSALHTTSEAVSPRELSILGLDGYRFDYRKFVIWPAVCLLLGTITNFFQSQVFQLASCLLLGASMAFVAAPLIMKWKG